MTLSAPSPFNPSLQQLRNQAKDLRKAHKAGEPSAIRRIGESHPRFSGSSQTEIAATKIAHADALLVIARELGFESWPRLETHIESFSSPETGTRGAAADSQEAMARVAIEKLGGRFALLQTHE